MNIIKHVLPAFTLILTANVYAVDNDLPLIEGIVNSIDLHSNTIDVSGLAYQSVKSTKIFLKDTGQITFMRITPGLKARLMLMDPPKLTKSGLPVLSSIHLSKMPAK